MRQLFAVLLVLISSNLFSQKYVQVWGDEFNTPGLPDSTKWGYEAGKLRNNELQYYTTKRLENCRIEDSVLVIETIKEKFEGADYTSASIISKGIGDWKYGKFEVKAKIPTGKGTWPAIWMMPTYKEYGGWPKSGEIDIMEYIGVEPQNLYFTTHFEGVNKGGHDSNGSGPKRIIRNPYNEFITFSVVWTPEKIEWFTNDVKQHEHVKSADDPRVWPFNKEFYLILNLAYGGNWAGKYGVDDTKLPHKFLIDYVRVYQLQDSEGPFSINITPCKSGSIEVSPKMDFYPDGTEITVTAIPDSNFNFECWQHQSGANPYSFKIKRNTTLTAVLKDKSQLLTNGDFTVGSSPWTFYNDGNTSKYNTTIENDFYVVNVTKSPGENWKLGFQELGLSLKKGKYKLTFDAFADMQETLLLTVAKNYSDYSSYISRYQNISTSIKSYELILDMPIDDENVRLYFGIGKFTGKFNIDNIHLSRIEETTTSTVKNELKKNEVSIFPNPSNGSFKIKIQDFSDNQTLFQIFSLESKLLIQKRIEQAETLVNTSKFNSGVYIIKLSNSKSISSHKLIIN